MLKFTGQDQETVLSTPSVNSCYLREKLKIYQLCLHFHFHSFLYLL